MPSDVLTVLTSLDDQPGKTFGLSDGSIVTVKAGKPFKFDCEDVPVGSFSELADALNSTQSNPQKVVIRGQLRDPDLRSDIRRTKENFEAVARQWCMIDIDDVELPEDLKDVSTNWQDVLLIALAHLPDEFLEADCWYQFSASMGIKPGKIRVHLWYWLNRKVSDDEMKAWLGDCPVDTRLFHPIQMHFTAKPIFEDGADDPIPDRSGIFQAGGGLDTVRVPNDLNQRAVVQSSRPSNVRTGGIVESQEIIRNEETGLAIDGRERLMFDLSNEVMRELVQSNRTDAITVDMIADRLWERFNEEAALSDDRWTRERAEEKARARFRELTEGTYSFTSRADSTTLIPTKEPYHQLDLVDAETGQTRLNEALDDFFEAVRQGDIPRQVIRITMGAGKTTRTIEKLREFFADERDRLVEVYVPRHDIAEEYIERLATAGNDDNDINARIIHIKPRTGGQVINGSRQFAPTCERPAYVRELEEKGIPVFPNACSEPDGATCQFFSGCPYLDQFRDPSFPTHDGNVLRIYTHSHLGLPRNTFEGERRPDLVIVDEGFLPSLLGGVVAISPELIRQHIRRDQFPNMGDIIVDGLRDGQPVLRELRATNVTYNDFGRIDLSALKPSVAFDEASDTAPQIGSAKDYNTLISVIQILNDEWKLSNRDQVERLVWDESGGTVRVCRLQEHRIPDDTAVLFLDATADRQLTERLVGPVEFARIDIEQGAFVTQVYDRTGSNTWWNDDPESEKVSALVGVLNEWVNYGEKPYCVGHKPLAERLRNRVDPHEGVKINHFGNLRGSNESEDQSVVFITGRNQPPHTSTDYFARAIFWDERVPLKHDDLTQQLPLELRGYTQSEANPHPPSGVMVHAFSDPRIEAIHSQQREAETVQAIARLRLVYTTYRKKVFLLGNLPVEMPIDRFVTFEDLMPDRLEKELIDKGNLPLTALGIVKMRPDLTTSVEAARKLIKRSNVSNPKTLLRSHPEISRAMLMVATFKAGDERQNVHKHLFVPTIFDADLQGVIGKVMDFGAIQRLLENGWGEISDLEIGNYYLGVQEPEEGGDDDFS